MRKIWPNLVTYLPESTNLSEQKNDYNLTNFTDDELKFSVVTGSWTHLKLGVIFPYCENVHNPIYILYDHNICKSVFFLIQKKIF